jgi:hypothetical protein
MDKYITDPVMLGFWPAVACLLTLDFPFETDPAPPVILSGIECKLNLII